MKSRLFLRPYSCVLTNCVTPVIRCFTGRGIKTRRNNSWGRKENRIGKSANGKRRVLQLQVFVLFQINVSNKLRRKWTDMSVGTVIIRKTDKRLPFSRLSWQEPPCQGPYGPFNQRINGLNILSKEYKDSKTPIFMSSYLYGFHHSCVISKLYCTCTINYTCNFGFTWHSKIWYFHNSPSIQR